MSPKGRNRVLRGLSNQAGTHRYVLWLTTGWRDHAELISTLQIVLQQLFGNAPEPLSDDPELAAAQYNGRSLIDLAASVDPHSVPLVAYDPALDALQLGLLDCPDIQSGIGTRSVHGQVGAMGQALADARRQQLAAVGRLCSAFIVLCKLNSLHDHGLLDVLTTLRDTMPGVQRILAVNRIKARYEPAVVAHEARALVDRFDIASVFAAYDFRSELAQRRIPPVPTGMVPEADGSPQPVFFQVGQSSAAEALETKTPSPCPLPRSGGEGSEVDSPYPLPLGDGEGFGVGNQSGPVYLYHLGQRLDQGTLSRESNRSLRLQLQTRVVQASQWHLKNPQLRRQQIGDAWQSIAAACYELMTQRDADGHVELRMQTSPAIIEQMSESLRRTAPIWLRPSLSIDRSARQLQKAVVAKTQGLWWAQNASKAVTDLASRFRRGEGGQIVTPERLVRSIRQHDMHDALSNLTDDPMHQACQQALQRFSAESQPELDASALDQWSRLVWENMPLSSKLMRGAQPVALITAPLLAALLLPIDGGGSAVLVFASVKELLAAAGIGALLGGTVAGRQLLHVIQGEVPWRQLSDLFAMLCDCLGLPRPAQEELPSCGTQSRQLLSSLSPSRENSSIAGLEVWQPNENSIARLQRLTELLI
ncbi:MAG TPA: hypothetical protein DCF63_08080 [Planctomycetaceae bacterium]|nr:hypothetical protein [Planctomycetaceae bacterium]